jgi:hypothetical protein
MLSMPIPAGAITSPAAAKRFLRLSRIDPLLDCFERPLELAHSLDARLSLDQLADLTSFIERKLHRQRPSIMSVRDQPDLPNTNSH